MHSRKSILFNNRSPRVKKDNDDLFDVTMGIFDGAEVCKLIGLSILNNLAIGRNIGQDGGCACAFRP